MPFEVPALPYDYAALEPHIDEATMRVHHDKHHQAYVDKANGALEGTQFAGQNERSFPVILQYIDDKSYVVWPKSQAQRDAVLPLPKGTTYSNQ